MLSCTVFIGVSSSVRSVNLPIIPLCFLPPVIISPVVHGITGFVRDVFGLEVSKSVIFFLRFSGICDSDRIEFRFIWARIVWGYVELYAFDHLSGFTFHDHLSEISMSIHIESDRAVIEVYRFDFSFFYIICMIRTLNPIRLIFYIA